MAEWICDNNGIATLVLDNDFIRGNRGMKAGCLIELSAPILQSGHANA